MFRKCIKCQHCKSKMMHFEDTPEPFNSSLMFYCLKENKWLGNMTKKKDEIEYLPCFKEYKEIKYRF